MSFITNWRAKASSHLYSLFSQLFSCCVCFYMNIKEVPISACTSYYSRTEVSGREGGTRLLHLQSRKASSKAERSFTIKTSVTNKVTQQKQELPKGSIFHKIMFHFSTFIYVTSREPCCAGFSSEGEREASPSPSLRLQRSHQGSRVLL